MDTEKKPRFIFLDRRIPSTPKKPGDRFMVPIGPASCAEAVVERVDELGVYASLGSMKLLGRFGMVHDSWDGHSGEMWMWEEMRL